MIDDEWLSTELNKLDLDIDVYGEYVQGIMSDEEMEWNERVESVMNLVSSATDSVGCAWVCRFYAE